MTLTDRIPTQAGAFVARFGGVVELSPWVAERAFLDGPFIDALSLHAAFPRALHAAERELQLEVLRAHPELAAERVIPREALTAESRSEQASAGSTASPTSVASPWRRPSPPTVSASGSRSSSARARTTARSR